MSARLLPVRPDLTQLKHQAKDLLRALHNSEPKAVSEMKEHFQSAIKPSKAKLADAQFILARSYGAASWARLTQSCRLIDAIWTDDADTVRKLVLTHPYLLHENAGIGNRNWGPPLTYAANLGRDGIIHLLRDLGADDLRSAFNRAALQGQIDTARALHAMQGNPSLPLDALVGPACTLNVPGTALAFELGAVVHDANGRCIAPINVVLENDGRHPYAKHQILEMYAAHGAALPDTPPLALHRGRLDLLQEHLRRDPRLLDRRFTHEEIYPPELGCHDEILANHGTPLAGTTLLHMCVDYDEIEIARWLLEHGMNVDARAAVDADGFGGHTALFASVVSQPNYWMNRRRAEPAAPFTQLLLDHGADPNVRASLRKQLHPEYGPDGLREYRDVTALSWGKRFHRQIFVNATAVQLIAAHGGLE